LLISKFCGIILKKDKIGDIMKNVIIVGSGPAGITAGIYLTRAKINNMIIYICDLTNHL
jgi:ribulose 1,5-bisphosphate synthetase/thiazole synthase